MFWQANNNIIINRNIIISERLSASGNVHFRGNFDKLLHATRNSPLATCHCPVASPTWSILCYLRLIITFLPTALLQLVSRRCDSIQWINVNYCVASGKW